ncbi:Activated Cdc42 Kinase 1, partial [Manis pentadactyla]
DISIEERVRFGSDVTGVQDGGSGLWLGMGDVNVPETLALRKELGSGSDVTGSARWWIKF